MEWFYSGLGGIYQTENSVAYKDLIIAPKTVGNIQWVKCSYNSINGLVSSEWKKTNDSFILDVEIPNNTTATVILPNDYVAYKCTVINNITNSQLDMNTEEGRFILTSGKYKIIAK
jgi:alpha-L-rhamnosidase